ncbi:MAG TPA: ATP-binding protein [Flavobacteriales bacterium]|nr:ATP-binding protein [Flavobacteriales bacterium]
MIERDHFGLEAERRIEKSGIRNIFTPHQPIQQTKLFFGRAKEVRAIIGYLNTPGQHALLFGNRGVGKSSLANIIADSLVDLRPGTRVIKKRCDSSDTFVTVVGSVLHYVGVNIQNTTVTEVQKSGLTRVIDLSQTKTKSSGGDAERALSPSWVAEKLSGLNGIFVVDELDALRSKSDKERIAELIKQLSDNGAALKLLVVGIAETPSELTAGHPSVSRCLKEVRLGNMEDSEIQAIIINGAERARIQFKPTVVSRIELDIHILLI